MKAKVYQSVAGINKAGNANVYSRAMMAYGRVEVQLHAFLKSALYYKKRPLFTDREFG